MFEGLFQPMHLLVIVGIACWSSDRKSFRNSGKESEKVSAASKQPLTMNRSRPAQQHPPLPTTEA